MRRLKRKLICLFVLFAFIQFSHGCQMEGVTNWLLPVSTSVLDTFRGNILDRSTSSIEGINSVSYGEGLNSGPYVDISYADSQFVMTTNNAYAMYEEYETSQSMPITVTFRCTGGSTSTLVFLINVIDTNNNAPQFQPPDGFVFTIAPPLPPGFEVTGCFNDISVRDIDLTTQRIEFEINDNPYFEIEYDAVSSTVAKEFKATLKTISFIRTLPEPITFTISATDVDLTGDPPLTTRTTVTIIGDTEFEFPEEPVFSEAFYLADYTDNQLVLSQRISLRSGYDNLVQFSLEGVYSNNFELVRVENDISIRVEIPLPAEALLEKQILLIIRADREYTSGDTATIIVELPEDIPLKFESTFYEGTIENNELRAPQLVLNQEYSDATVTAVVISEYSSFFTANVNGNIVSLLMTPLMANIIEENSFINIEVVASTERSTATAVVTLEIIKDDTVTPVFNRPIYSGSYNPDTGLTLEEILLVQGYDQTVVISLEGEHENLFQVQNNGVSVTLMASNIPSELFGEQQIILTIIASKERTVGANAAVIINLPAARELLFEASTYRGILEESALTLEEILLVTGYDEDIVFDVTGDYGQYFTVTNVQNQVIVSYTTPMPENIITENNVLILTITASGTHTVSAVTTLLLEIIKDDITTPVFSRNVYYGTYTGTSINIENIFLVQGFSNDVSFELNGDQTQLEYFEITGSENNSIQLQLRSEIPENLIYGEKFFLLNIKVDKRRTVGASAAIVIRFPTELIEPVILRFAQNTYTGTIENNVLTTESIILSSGYAEGTEFQHFGDYSTYFELTDINNALSLSLINTLPIDEIDAPFIVLEIEARRERAVSVWTSLVIDLVRPEVISPVFTEVFYRGVYSAASGLQFNDEISLLTGFDNNVDFNLEGDHASLFTLIQGEPNLFSIVADTSISQEILDVNTQFLLVVVAHKPGTTSARSTISIAIEKESDVLILGFAQTSYVGVIDDNQLQLPTITIVGDYAEVASVGIIGEYEAYFTIRRNANEINIELTTPLPTNIVNDNAFITFELEASHENAISGFTTIIVRTPSISTTLLQFDRVSYIGTLQENLAEIQPITLIEGYTNYVMFGLYGDLSEYFSYTPQGAVVNVALQTPIPAGLIPANRIIVLEIRASSPLSLSAYATIVFEVIVDEDVSSAVQLVFDSAYYTGSYGATTGLLMDTSISLSEGYDDSVQFELEGDDSQWFSLTRNQNSVTLVVSSGIPGAVLTNNRQLVFAIAANRLGSNTARSAIVVALTDEYTEEAANIGFDRVTYVGTIANNVASLQPITLIEGYTNDVTFGLYGDLSEYFSYTPQGAVVNVALQTPIPAGLIPANRIIVLEIRASSPLSLSAYATIVFEVIVDEDVSSAVQLVFDSAYYTGSYGATTGLLMDTSISLSEGYDDSVQFELEGDDSQWFSLTRNQNSVTLVVSSGIPGAVLTNNRQLVFAIAANRLGSNTARSAIVVALTDEYTEEAANIGFDRVTYVGTIANNVASLQPITLIEGYTNDVTFGLYGDLSEYFSYTPQGAVVNVALQTPIPAGLIPANRIIVLEIRASSPLSLSAYATIVFEVIVDEDVSSAVQLVFDSAYYTGSYGATTGLLMDTSISLSEGYDDSVQFELEGDDSQWFSLTRNQNSVTLVVSSGIPGAVLTNNRQLVFAIAANRLGSNTARSAIVVALTDEYTEEAANIGFDRVTYVGTIANNVASLQPITLIEGYTNDVTFGLYGDLSEYFSYTPQGAVVNVALQTPIPAGLIPANRIIVLEIRASSPLSLSAYATIVFEVIVDEDVSSAVQLVFDSAYYTGSYGATTGLLMDTSISLSEGYDDSVQFELEGDDSQWFSLTRNQNSVTLVVSSGIPGAVLTNNRQLVFAIAANRLGSNTARSAIVVALTDEYTEEAANIGFDRVTYVGTIANNVASLQPITLIEGYTNDVTFGLYGDLSEYFSYTPQGAVVNVALQTPIPAGLIPANRIIVLEIRASSPLSLSAYATIVFEVIVDEDVSSAVQLVFGSAYYTGSYGATTGLLMDTSISLSEGYDDSVQFELEGDDSQWFSLTRNQNSVTLVVSSGIPGAVLTNNRQLVFAIAANRLGSNTARSAIVVALTDEYTEEAANIGFDRVTYVGTIANNVASLQPITLIEGYTNDVTFGLYGDLSEYFSYTPQGAVVNVALQTPIPAGLIPANRIIVLEIRASSPLSLSAYATIVFEVIVDEDVSSAVQLVFDSAYYTGSYGATTGLLMDTSISLSEGYDDSVQFELEGDDSQWFSLTRNQNSVTLVVSSGIPGAVLTNNRQLVFAIAANRLGSNTARSAIVVALTDEYTEEAANIGFDRVTYVGTIANNVASLQPITLIEGYTNDVTFGLYGDLSEYFSYTPQGAVVNVALQTPIPAGLIPANRIIVLEIRASSPLSLSAYATIVFEVIVDEDVSSAVQLVFGSAYYTGSYGATTGLLMDTSISLSEGYDDSVQFELEGDDSQWFSLTRNQNSVTLVVSSGIPGAVLTNNRQLVFAIAANRLGSNTARSAIVVALTDEYTEEAANIGFDRVTYVGTIANNVASLQPITLIEGYTNDVTFGLYGDLSEYFSYTPQGAVVNVALQTPIPAGLIPANRIIVLEIRASSPLSLSAYATIVFEVIVDEDVSSAVQLVFDSAYYTGSYGATTGLLMDTSISLSEGYDDSVQFELEGDDSQWFSLTRNQNSVTLVVSSGIPGAVLTNNRQLVFAIAANRLGSNTARSAIVVALTDEYTEEAANIGFDRVTYVGTIANNVASLQPITLIEGYTNDVTFGLYGDLSEYFSYTPQGAVVNVALQTPIPAGLIPANRIIVLEIRASSPLSLSAYATIVFEVIVDEDVSSAVQLVFDSAYYTGSYGATTGLLMDTSISLSEGYDDSVQFELEGDDSQWFSLTRNQNSVTLVVSSGIPGAVLTNNRQLVFAIAANRLGSNTARSAIVVALTDEYTEEAANIGFDRVTYVGTIANNVASLQPITLIEGYTNDVTFGLYGDLSEYFSYTPQGAVVNVALQTPIPAGLIPANRIIVLEIRASSPLSLSAYATIVFEVIVDEDVSSAVQLVFGSAYYTGSYGATTGLLMDTSISLSEGYDDSVQFELEGDDSQWFSLTRNQNSVTLVVSSGIPGAVLTNNRQLVFAIAANRLGSNTARSAIVVALTDEYTEEAANIGFDRVTYVGTIANNVASLQPITLIEGYTNDVTFGLYGDLSEYFSYTPQGAVVNVALQTPIPAGLIPANRIIVLEIRASSPLSLSAYATIVFEVIVDEDVSSAVQLVFDSAYYTGSYGATTGLLMDTSISLSEGYDDSVQFELEGDDSQWFSLTRNQNSVTLVVSSGIPGAVLTNNRQLVFAIAANRLGSNTARSAIVVALTDEYTEEAANIGFDRVTYVGTIANNVASLQPITLIEGYTNDVTFGLYGDLSEYFSYTPQGAVVNVALQTPIPAGLIPANRIIVLEIRASSPLSLSAYATIVFEVIVDEDVSSAVQLVFDSAYYTGSYGATTGLLMDTSISLSEGYDDSVQFELEGDDSQWFSLTRNQNSVTLVVSSGIPGAVLTNNRQLVFAIAANRLGSNTARSAIVVALTDEYTEEAANIGFDRVTYVGTIANNVASLQPITLIEGYTNDVTFGLYGDLSEYFSYTPQGAVVNVALQTPIPAGLIPANRIIVLEIRASSPLSLSAYATIVFEVIVDEDVSSAVQLVFDSAYYTGSYGATTGLLMDTSISLSEGYDDSVQFELEGDDSQWFSLTRNQNSVTLVVSSGIPGAVLTNNRQLVFAIAANRLGSNTARSAIVVALTDEYTEEAANIGFDRVTYVGTIANNVASLQPITLIEGYTNDVTFGLYGDLSEYFSYTPQGAVVNVALQTPIPAGLIPANRIIVLEIRASSPLSLSAYATIVFEVIVDEDVSSAVQLVFDSAYYTGSYGATTGLLMDTSISLSEGYDDSVQFELEGDDSQWFSLTRNQNSVTLVVSSGIPGAVLTNNRQLVFAIAANRLGSTTARSAIVVSLVDDLQAGNDVTFDKILYEGIIQLDTVIHESIVISGFSGTSVDIFGEYSIYFEAYVLGGTVTVQTTGTLALPIGTSTIALELHADLARAVLLLNILQEDAPIIPTVVFSSESYRVNVDIVQTGLIGRVQATADNGEAISYSLAIADAHLQTRLSINNVGELYLSAPANSGVYSFQVIASTAITQTTATATVYLTVEAITICGEDNNIVVPPLIILDRDEEEVHNNLVVLDASQYEGCQFSLTNRWPVDQTWLYVDENGLHTTAIDREHESIAFMALSQVQVELILSCPSDNVSRTKRSTRTDWLGPYDYGANKWILTESIPFNSRRSLVNLIVNDINDNNPIFIGKEYEPIAVGYPTAQLEERIMPRSIAELQATDADIGENAELLYWSSESALAVAPTTGSVHVRNGAQLQDNQILQVSATDRNGQGLTGSIQLMVKLLDLNNIAIVTVRDAFLDDESTILAQLSNAIGYEVKTLRSVVISDDTDKAEVSRNFKDLFGVSLQLYVYGLINREPVSVDRLAEDINGNAALISVVSTVSLEDYLEVSQISVLERDTGLLVATIVLSVLLFALMMAVTVWFFLKWRADRNYDRFSDENSLASRNESLTSIAKPAEIPKPRLNIEELKKSERRLQEMLNASIEEVTVEPAPSTREVPVESILDLSSSEPYLPIVIQSIDKLKDADDTDEDEFGEQKAVRRKSVVTFNENVEKIIHVEDVPDDDSSSGYEVYRF